MGNTIEGQPQDSIPTTEVSVETFNDADKWANLPGIKKARLQNIYKRHSVMEQMGEYFHQCIIHCC